MRLVNRTVEMSEGDILIGGESVRERDPARLRREIGYVIQEVGLFPHRTIAAEHRHGAAAAGLEEGPDRGAHGASCWS